MFCFRAETLRLLVSQGGVRGTSGPFQHTKTLFGRQWQGKGGGGNKGGCLSLYREKNLGDFRVFFLFCMACFGCFGVFIIPKWLIKVSGHIPVLFG